MLKGQRENLFIVSVKGVDGTDYGFWDSKSGGDNEVSLASRKISGNITVQMGGTATKSDIKCTRLHRVQTNAQWEALYDGAGKIQLVVVMQQKDDSGAPFGKPRSYTGVLGTVPDLVYDETSNGDSIEEINIGLADA